MSGLSILGVGSASNALYIGSNACVGIGKSNAAYALDVVGEINASSNIRIAGQSLQGLGVPNQVVLSSTNTWTVPSGITNVKVQGVGAGGGGGGGTLTSPYAAGGGGAGGYFEAILNVSAGLNLVCTIGAAGASEANSINTAASAGGNTTIVISGTTVLTGSGGNGGVANTSVAGGDGGIGGNTAYSLTGSYVQSTSMILCNGGDGDSAIGLNSTPDSGNGGASYFGGGGIAARITLGGANGNAFGSGGGGGRYGNGVTSVGGTGAPGVVIISYFTQSGLPTNYTATAPLSMSGTTLTIANATTSAPGVVKAVDGYSINGSNHSVTNYSEGGTRVHIDTSGRAYVPMINNITHYGTMQFTTDYTTFSSHGTSRFFYMPAFSISIPTGKQILLKIKGMNGRQQNGLAIDFFDSVSNAWLSESTSGRLIGQNSLFRVEYNTSGPIATDDATKRPCWIEYAMNMFSENSFPQFCEINIHNFGQSGTSNNNQYGMIHGTVNSSYRGANNGWIGNFIGGIAAYSNNSATNPIWSAMRIFMVTSDTNVTNISQSLTYNVTIS